MVDHKPPPEPGDGTRLEFEYGTDVYAVWRDDESSRAAGWRAGAGGETWLLYGESVPVTWDQLRRDFGDEALANATRLYTQAELDQAVSAGRREAGLTVIGDHLMEPGGYCRTCGVAHSPQELARIEDRLAGEAC